MHPASSCAGHLSNRLEAASNGASIDAGARAAELRRKPRCSLPAFHCLAVNTGDTIGLESDDILPWLKDARGRPPRLTGTRRDCSLGKSPHASLIFYTKGGKTRKADEFAVAEKSGMSERYTSYHFYIVRSSKGVSALHASENRVSNACNGPKRYIIAQNGAFKPFVTHMSK